MRFSMFCVILTVYLEVVTTLLANEMSNNEDWTNALPFTKTLKFAEPLMTGKDVTILQNLLRRYDGIELEATSNFDKGTEKALIKFQHGVGLRPADGILNPATGEKVIEMLMSDGYKDDGKIPDWAKFKFYLPVHRDRNIETTGILYASNGEILHKFTARAQGSTGKAGNRLNQLTTNGNTPTGLSTCDLNSPEPIELVKSFGPYPVLRAVKGLRGNAVMGRDNYTGIDGKDTFLSNYRTGILVHTGEWDDWHSGMPLPSTHGCIRVAPTDMKTIVDLLVSKTETTVNENPFGKLPYPYKLQGIISIEQID